MNKQVELYEMLMELLKAEEKCRNEVRDSQNEVSLHHIMSLNSKWNIGKCPEFFFTMPNAEWHKDGYCESIPLIFVSGYLLIFPC